MVPFQSGFICTSGFCRRLEFSRDALDLVLSDMGANHTLAGALVAFRLLRNIGGEEADTDAK